MNVLNVQDIERELRKIAAYASYGQVSKWVMTVARNYVLGSLPEADVLQNYQIYTPIRPKHRTWDMPKESDLPNWARERLRAGEDLHWFDPIQVNRRSFWKSLRTIVEWFNTFPDKDVRLNRISRINFETAAYGSARWMSLINANVWDFVKDKPPIMTKYENGFFWVRLMTHLHFEREGKLMNHCVGGYSYFQMHQSKQAEFYSLRDQGNRPHATLQVQNKSVVQCKGNSNRKPAPDYQRYLRPFIAKMGWSITGDTHHID